jgi:hypothetical protein
MAINQTSKGLHISLWIAQGLLAAAFGMAGFMKTTAPLEQLAQNGMTFVTDFGTGMVRFIGISEILGAIGLILPSALRIKPVFTPLAALGLAVIMLLATGYHLMHGEPFAASLAILFITLFIAYGRFVKVPVQSK